jgi:hypothetical protein
MAGGMGKRKKKGMRSAGEAAQTQSPEELARTHTAKQRQVGGGIEGMLPIRGRKK